MEIEQIIKLMEAVSANGLTEFSYEEQDQKGNTILKLKKKNEVIQQVVPAGVPAVTAAAVLPAAEAAGAEHQTTVSGNAVKCPLVGTFYAASSPDAEPFVKVGDHVSKGQVLGIVEAMKLMNEIESDFDGTVKEICVGNGDLVEYGQDLFIIE